MHSTCTDRLTKAAKRYVSPGTRPLTNAEAEARALAQLIKSPDCDADLVAAAAREMARLIDGEHCNLIPVPDHTGRTDANARLACAIAFCSPHAEVFDVLTRYGAVESACERHRKRLPPTPPEKHGICRRPDKSLVPLRTTYFVDNVLTSGNTIEACRRAFHGLGTGLVYADAHHDAPNKITTSPSGARRSRVPWTGWLGD